MFLLSIPVTIAGFIGWHVYEDRTHISNYYREHTVVETVKDFAMRAAVRTLTVADEVKRRIVAKYETGTEKKGRNKYEVTYFVGHRRYRMPIKRVGTPCRIARVIADSVDVTDRVLEYYGPQQDWHNKTLSPKSFNHTTMVFELIDGSELTFTEDEPININPSSGFSLFRTGS